MDFLISWLDQSFSLLLTLTAFGVALLVVLCAFLAIVSVLVKLVFFSNRKRGEDGQVSIGFFHPYCDAGGGGERVLWVGVR
jgi:hypothetical protein